MSLNAQAVLDKFGLNRPNLPVSSYTDIMLLTAARRWVPVLVWQMTTAEMQQWGVAGQTACFQILIDDQGKPITNVDMLRATGIQVRYQWSTDWHIAPIEKPWPEPPANFVMGAGGEYMVELAAGKVSSDFVYGITLHNPNDTADPHGHHATVIVWQLQDAHEVPTNPVQPPQPPQPVAGYKTIKTQAILDLLTALDAQIAALQAQRREVASWLN